MAIVMSLALAAASGLALLSFLMMQDAFSDARSASRNVACERRKRKCAGNCANSDSAITSEYARRTSSVALRGEKRCGASDAIALKALSALRLCK
jgi:hypothetical protein